MNRTALTASLIVFCVFATATANDSPAPPSLSVVGTGEVQSPPDMAEINVGVVTEAASAQEALQSNSDAMSGLLGVLKEHNVADKDIQTTSFDVSPVYEQDRSGKEPPQIVGYRVTNQVHVRVCDLDSLGQLLDAVVSAGANRVNGISFGISDTKPLMDEARRGAVRDARRKAELLAAEAGVQLGSFLEIVESSFTPGPVRGMAEFARTAVPVAAGEQTLVAHVSVKYALQSGGHATTPTQHQATQKVPIR